MPQFFAADSSSTTYSIAGTFDATGQIFTATYAIAPGSQIGTVVAPGTPISRSQTVPVSSPINLMPANAIRKSISFQVPVGSPGIYMSWTGAAGVNTNDSFFFPGSTLLVSLDVSVVGLGPISVFSPTGGFYLPATEC